MVLTGLLGIRGRSLLGRFLQEFEVEPLPFGEKHWEIAFEAFLHFGKGRHPAKLNLGDCMSYATAYLAGEPLLCVGNDFTQTDLPLVDLGPARCTRP